MRKCRVIGGVGQLGWAPTESMLGNVYSILADSRNPSHLEYICSLFPRFTPSELKDLFIDRGIHFVVLSASKLGRWAVEVKYVQMLDGLTEEDFKRLKKC